MLKKYIYAKESLKIVKIECIINDKILKKIINEMDCTYEKKDNSLSSLVNKILICPNITILSYLIKDLLCYEYKDEIELDFLKKILLCFYFKEAKGLFDLKKILLNQEYKKSLKKQNINYIDESIIIKQVDDFPIIKVI